MEKSPVSSPTVSLFALLVLILSAWVALSAAGTTWTVRVGFDAYSSFDPVESERGTAWQSTRFYPSNLTIYQYDTITFVISFSSNSQLNYAAIGHIPANTSFTAYQPQNDGTIKLNSALLQPTGGQYVTSNQVITSSGLLGPSTVSTYAYYSLTFGSIASFTFTDLFRPLASSEFSFALNVVSPNASLAYTAAEVDLWAKQQMAKDMAARATLEQTYRLVPSTNSDSMVQPLPNTINAQGNNIWIVQVGFHSSLYRMSYLRFIPSKLEIAQGDSVRFVLGDVLPHIISLGYENQFVDTFLSVGADQMYIQSVYAQRSSQPINANNMIVSSGLVLYGGGALGGQWIWEVEFDTAGQFNVICALNRGNRMEGQITVVEGLQEEEHHHEERNMGVSVGIFFAILIVFYSIAGILMS